MLKAYGSKIIVELEKDDFIEKNGLMVPTKALMREYMKKKGERYEIGGEGYTNHIRHGMVVSIGNKTKNWFKIDDTVILNRHNGVEFDHDGKHYIAIEEIDIPLIYRKP